MAYMHSTPVTSASVEGRGGGLAGRFGLGLTGAGLVAALLVADGQSDADWTSETWFRLLLGVGALSAVGGIGLGLWELFSTYVHPLPRIPTAMERRDSRNARTGRVEARQRYLQTLRDAIVEREARAVTELEESRFTNRLAGFGRWIRTNRKGIARDEELHGLLQTWDSLLASANAYEEGMQAAWDTTDYMNHPDSIAPFGDADRERLVDLIAAIVEARRAVQALLRE
jgi:hypothetical protein